MLATEVGELQCVSAAFVISEELAVNAKGNSV